jgi:hypothetical protein
MKLNGKRLNGRGGKPTTDNLVAVRSAMVGKPKGRLGQARDQLAQAAE